MARGGAGTSIFPWEDWRKGRPEILSAEIEPRLREWAQRPALRSAPVGPCRARIASASASALDGGAWDEEKVLDRFELLYEAGLVEEARRDGREAALSLASAMPRLGAPMQFDHRRILATAIGRVRAKIKYRPVIFELMPDDFTLFELQKTVEAILGPHLHKQNFRRLVESAGLVEPTGRREDADGRPAGEAVPLPPRSACSSGRHQACASNQFVAERVEARLESALSIAVQLFSCIGLRKIASQSEVSRSVVSVLCSDVEHKYGTTRFRARRSDWPTAAGIFQVSHMLKVEYMLAWR